jgi:histidinol-phosphate aminotransferase
LQLSDEDHIKASLTLNQAERLFFYEAFDSLDLVYTPSQSNFILLQLEKSAHFCFQALLERGIIVRQGHAWGLPHHIRITVGSHSENRKLVSALKEIFSLIRSIHPKEA